MLIITHGSEVWGIVINMDYEKWDKCVTERNHLQFCKHILGVNRACSNHRVRYETGRYPIKSIVNTIIFLFPRHIKSMPQSSIVHQALSKDKNLHNSGSQGIITSFIKNHKIVDKNKVTGDSIQCLTERKTKKIFHKSYEALSFFKLVNNPEASIYFTFKQRPMYETYFDIVKIDKFQFNTLNLD